MLLLNHHQPCTVMSLSTPDAKRHRRQDTNHQYDKMMEIMTLTRIHPQKKRRQRVDTTPIPRKRLQTSEVGPLRKHLKKGKSFPLQMTNAGSNGWSGETRSPDFDGESSPTVYSSVGKVKIDFFKTTWRDRYSQQIIRNVFKWLRKICLSGFHRPLQHSPRITLCGACCREDTTMLALLKRNFPPALLLVRRSTSHPPG